MAIHTIQLSADKQTELTVDEYGSGRSFLLLHGGGGPQSMLGFAQRLAGEPTHVYMTTHPGFGGTPRPEWLNNLGYCELRLGLPDAALEHFAEARLLAPHYDPAWLNAARALQQKGDWEGARRLLQMRPLGPDAP